MINLNNIKFAGNIKTQDYTPPVPYALSFDGVDDYVTGPDTGYPVGNATRSISWWFKLTEISTGVNFFDYGTLTNNQWCIVGIDRRSNRHGISFSQYGAVNVGTEKILTPDVWYHAVVTWNSGTTKIYVNGINSGLQTLEFSGSINTVLRGDYQLVPYDHNLNGEMDEIALWSKELSQNEITDLYNNGNGLYVDPASNFPSGGSMGTNLVGLWHLDEGSGIETLDAIGNNNGTLTNGPTWADGKIQIP